MNKIIIIILTLSVSIAFAQNDINNESSSIPKVSPPTPDVHSLYKFTEIPVSNTTGIPNISIPIHEIRLKEFSLPISVDYHSSGIIIDEVSSDVGLGWALKAGGMISQIVMGKQDIGNGYSLPQDDVLDDSYPPPTLYPNPNQDYYLLKELSAMNAEPNSGMDTEPDVYMFSAGSFNGKFFFDVNGNAHTIPKSDIKIIRNSPFNYTIIDEVGNKYFYQTIAYNYIYNNLGYSSNGLGASSFTENFSLYLTKIETSYKEIIDFEYNDITYKYKNPSLFTRKKRDLNTYGLDQCTTTWVGNLNDNGSAGFEFEIYNEYSNLVEVFGKSIKKILVNNNQTIEFNYQNCPRLDLPSEQLFNSTTSTGSFALNNITIKNYKTQMVNSFNFIYEYFNLSNYQECISTSNDLTRDSYRLKLKEIVKNNIEKHMFEYFENEILPSRLSNYYDHWNRFKTNITGFGNFVLDYTYTFLDGINRNPDLESSKLGTLKKIIYPTKGHTEFIYGLNKSYGTYKLYNPPQISQVSLFLNGTQEIGIPNEEQNLVTTFTLTNNSKKPTIQVYSPMIENFAQTGWTLQNYYNMYIIYHENPNKIIPFVYLNQNGQAQGLEFQAENAIDALFDRTIGPGTYSLYVIGKDEGLGAIISWIESTPQETETGNMNIGGLRIEQIINYSRENIVESKKYYEYNLFNDPSKSSGIVINWPVYTYNESKYRVCSKTIAWNPTLGSSLNSNVLLEYKYITQQNKPYFPMNLLNGYHIMYPQVKVFNEVNKELGYSSFKYSYVPDDPSYSVNSGGNTSNHSSSSFICPATSLDFLRGDLLEKIDYKKTNSGFVKVSENKYEYFYTEGNSFFNDNINNYRIGLKLEEYFKEKTTVRLAGGIQFPDDRFPSLFNLGYYKLQSVKKYLSKTEETVFDLNGNNPVKTISNYSNSNPLHNQITSRTLINSLGETIETKYSYAHETSNTDLLNKNMIGIPLKTETKRNGTIISTQETVYKNWGNGLFAPEFIKTSKSNQSLETKITFNSYDTKGNITQYTQESGVPVSIIWGYNQTQPVAKLENIAYGSIPASLITNIQTVSNLPTSTEADVMGVLNALRTSTDANLQKALITTYTYKPLIGVSTITDPKGDKMTYEYDAFGRLSTVKDKTGNKLSENEYHYRP